MAENIPELPNSAQLAFEENWSPGKIDPGRWYALRKQWGQNNNGVVPENVSLVKAKVDGTDRFVLECRAHGDQYDGPVTGLWNKKARVGGVLVTKQSFASGRFQVRMRIGSPSNPTPAGTVPAIWTYGYRVVKVDPSISDNFTKSSPLYHPYLQQWGKGIAFYWSEIDFPEFGKNGSFTTPMFNTFLNKQHDSRTFDIHGSADGQWHTYTTDWHTELIPLPNVTDAQVTEAEGFFWVQDKSIPYESYWGNPLKRNGKDDYSVYSGKVAKHWVDGKFVGENTKFVPSMTGQLNLGIWLPKWAGPAPWKEAKVHFADVTIWQFNEPGDVRGILTEDIGDSFDENGTPIAP
ncbi:MAG: glycoside hydrolase family 16 protein [Verrucomicrobiales bacterium]|nr:glycoside hydrolase family 16 protein [Verrucomicrobiales bacterium]